MRTPRDCVLVLLLGLLGCAPEVEDAKPERAPLPMLPVIETPPPPMSAHRTLSTAQLRELLNLPEDEMALLHVVNKLKVWPRGTTLEVAFIGGDTTLHRDIAAIAAEWNGHADIRLDFGFDAQTAAYRQAAAADTSAVRVGFHSTRQPTLWARTGLDAHGSAPGEPTINFQGFDQRRPMGDRFRYQVLHEFGHVLGLEHEHSNPNGICDEEIDFLMARRLLTVPPNSWSPTMVTSNLARLPNSTNDYDASRYDPLSVMNYALDASIYKRGAASECFVPLRTQLSVRDKQGIKRAYQDQVISLFDSTVRDARSLIQSQHLSPDYRSDIQSMLDEFTSLHQP